MSTKCLNLGESRKLKASTTKGVPGIFLYQGMFRRTAMKPPLLDDPDDRLLPFPRPFPDAGARTFVLAAFMSTAVALRDTCLSIVPWRANAGVVADRLGLDDAIAVLAPFVLAPFDGVVALACAARKSGYTGLAVGGGVAAAGGSGRASLRCGAGATPAEAAPLPGLSMHLLTWSCRSNSMRPVRTSPHTAQTTSSGFGGGTHGTVR